MIKKKLLFFYILIALTAPAYSASVDTYCVTPRDISTDSMLELALVNYHRYHTLEQSNLSLYAKPFFTGTTHNQMTQAGMLFTGYYNVTKAIWVGINTAAMGTKMGNVSTGGLDDIQFKLAYDLLQIEDAHGTGYLVATAPTGKKNCCCPLTKPQVGSRNGSLGLGINLDAVFADTDDYEFSWEFDLKYRHTFSPDFYYTPRNTIDVWTALNFPIYDFNLEIGYDFWWQQSMVHLLSSTQKLYADLGYHYTKNNFDTLFGLGAAYEFAPKNSAPKRTNTLEKWTVWFTAGIVF